MIQKGINPNFDKYKTVKFFAFDVHFEHDKAQLKCLYKQILCPQGLYRFPLILCSKWEKPER